MTKKNKIRLTVVLLTAFFTLLFIDRCTLVNLSTADILRPKSYENFKSLLKRPSSKSYEIFPVNTYFPVLYDSIQNEFYVANYQGLTKYDSLGRILISDGLKKEKFTSIDRFYNFTPFVFTQNGVYDFSGDQLRYSPFLNILNKDNSLNAADFKITIEKFYGEADLAIFDLDLEVSQGIYAYPMYFNIDDKWILLFAPQNEYRFSHQNSQYSKDDIIGQIDFENFPAKLGNKKLIVLKDENSGRYSLSQQSEIIDDDYLETYYSQILKEKKFNYKTSDKVKLLSRKKIEYYSRGSVFDLPDWMAPSFMNTGYFELSYKNEKINFKEKVMKYSGESKIKNELYLYELPKHLRKKSSVAFLHYALDLGGVSLPSADETVPIIKNAGLYIIKPKN